MPTEPLSQKEIEDRLRELPGWSQEGDRIARAYRLSTHFAATAMVVHIATDPGGAEPPLGSDARLQHLALSVNSHDAGGAVTEKDFELAQRVEEIAAGHGAG